MPETSQSISAGCTHAVPCLRASNAKAIIEWVVRVLGAEARHVFEGPDGLVQHSEIWFGTGCVMIGTLKTDGIPPTQPGQGAVYIVAPNAATVDELYERARAAGAPIPLALRDTDYGSHDFACMDPEGNYWGFGTYAPAD